MSIRQADSDEEIAACFPVMHQLRPHLTPDSFRARVRSQQRAGYRLAYVEADGRPVAVAGFRILETLVSGRAPKGVRAWSSTRACSERTPIVSTNARG